MHYWWECKFIQPLCRTVLRVLKKTKNRTTIWPTNPTPRYISEENHTSKRYLHPNVDCITICSNQDSRFSSVTRSCPTLCDPMNCSTPGLPVHHQLQELTQTHVHPVSDAIQQSHPLLSVSPPAFNLSQHQCLFK